MEKTWHNEFLSAVSIYCNLFISFHFCWKSLSALLIRIMWEWVFARFLLFFSLLNKCTYICTSERGRWLITRSVYLDARCRFNSQILRVIMIMISNHIIEKWQMTKTSCDAIIKWFTKKSLYEFICSKWNEINVDFIYYRQFLYKF